MKHTQELRKGCWSWARWSEEQLGFPAHLPPQRGWASQVSDSSVVPSRLTTLFPAEPARNNTGSGFIFTPGFVIYHYWKTKRQVLAEYPEEYSRSPCRIWPSICRIILFGVAFFSLPMFLISKDICIQKKRRSLLVRHLRDPVMTSWCSPCDIIASVMETNHRHLGWHGVFNHRRGEAHLEISCRFL